MILVIKKDVAPFNPTNDNVLQQSRNVPSLAERGMTKFAIISGVFVRLVIHLYLTSIKGILNFHVYLR